MDAFKLNKNEVLNLDQNEFLSMYTYAWIKFNMLRNEQGFKKENNNDIIYFNKGEDFVSDV